MLGLNQLNYQDLYMCYKTQETIIVTRAKNSNSCASGNNSLKADLTMQKQSHFLAYVQTCGLLVDQTKSSQNFDQSCFVDNT